MEDPVIMEPSERTAFVYRVEGGMDDRDLDEIEAMDSGYVMGANWPSIVSEWVDIGHRMRYMRKRGLGFRFLRMEDPDLENMLRDIDPDMPEIIAWVMSDFYLNGTGRLSDLTDNIESVNPLGYDRPRANGTYREKILRFLMTCASRSGMEPSGELRGYELRRVPVGKYGSAEIWKTPLPSHYEMRLVLEISMLDHPSHRRLTA
jgi:HpaII restriction endonuclease.